MKQNKQKYYQLAQRIKALKKQNKQLTQELKLAVREVKNLKKQKQKSRRPIEYLKDLEMIQKRAVREAKKRKPDLSSEYLSDFLELVAKDTAESIEYKDVRLVNVFQQVMKLMDEGYKVELRGIRQDVNRPFNLAFETSNSFKKFVDGFWDRYDSDSVLFTGAINYSKGINFKKVKRSKYGTGVHFEFDIEEFEGTYSYIPSSKHCFVKSCWWILNKEGYDCDYNLLLSTYQDFLLRQTSRKGVMTQARISKFNDELEYKFIIYNENTRKYKPSKTRTNQRWALYLKGNHYCVVSVVNPLSGIREINNHYKEIKTAVNENNLMAAPYSPSTQVMDLMDHLNNILVFDLECYKDADWVFHPYACGYFFLSNLRQCYNNSEFSEEEIAKFKEKVKISIGSTCIEEMFKYLGKFTGDVVKMKKKVVSNQFTVVAHNASGFDNYFVTQLVSLAPSNILKTAKGIIYLKVRNNYWNLEGSKETRKSKEQRGGDTQYLIFKCSANYVNSSLKNICRDYKLPAGLCKSELEHQDITETNWIEKRNSWEPYLKLDVLSLSFFLARYIAGTVEFSKFGVKDTISAPGQAWKALYRFNSEQNGKTFNCLSFTDKYTRQFTRKCAYGGRVGAFINKFESNFASEIFGILEQEFHTANIIDESLRRQVTMKRYFSLQEGTEYSSLCEKLKEYGSKDDVLMAFDGTSLYPSAMALPDAKYPDLNSCVPFTPDMEDTLLEVFNTEKFTDLTGLFHCRYFNPLNLLFQHLPAKDKDGVNRLRNGFIDAHLSSVDMEEIVKIGGKIIRIYEGVIFDSHFEESPFKKFVEHLFELRLKYKKEANDVMQTLVKLMLNSLYGKTIQKDINKEVHIWSEETLRAKFDERIVDYSRLNCGKYIVELKEEEGVDVEEDKKGYTPSHLGVFILSYSKRIMNNFIRAIDGFYNPVIYYTDTDSLYIHKNHWDKLAKAGLVGGKLGQGKNDYETGGIFYSLFLGSKIKYCLTIDADGKIKAHSTFKGFNKEGLSFENYLEIQKGNNINTKQSLKWKRSFENGVIFRDKIDKEFNAACNINKRIAADTDGLMLPYNNITEELFEEYKEVMKQYYKVEVSDDYEDFLNEYPNVIDI